MDLEALELVQKPLCFQILVVLSKNSGLKREDVYSQIRGSRDTKRTRVNELIAKGLILEKRKYTHNIKELHITDKGRAIAELAISMNSILSENRKSSKINECPASIEHDSDHVFDVSDYLAEYNGNKILEHIEDNPGICLDALEEIFGTDTVRNRIGEAEKLGLIKRLNPSDEDIPCFFVTDDGREVVAGLKYAQKKQGDIEPNCQADLASSEKNRVI